MLARGHSVFLAGPRIYSLPSDPGHPRGNITLYESKDGGSTWRNVALLHRGSSGYSSMVNLKEAIGIAYCASTTGHADASKLCVATNPFPGPRFPVPATLSSGARESVLGARQSWRAGSRGGGVVGGFGARGRLAPPFPRPLG